jgi:hypothetical protein
LDLDQQVRRLLGGGGVGLKRWWRRVGGERISGRSERSEVEGLEEGRIQFIYTYFGSVGAGNEAAKNSGNCDGGDATETVPATAVYTKEGLHVLLATGERRRGGREARARAAEEPRKGRGMSSLSLFSLVGDSVLALWFTKRLNIFIWGNSFVWSA